MKILSLFFALCFISMTAFADSKLEKLCENLLKEGKAAAGKSLGEVRESLNKVFETNISTLGTAAKDSAPHFENNGFIDISKNDLLDLTDIPIGSILILEKDKNSTCPVDQQWGHIAVKCTATDLYWGNGNMKSIKSLLPLHSRCVKSVLVHPKLSPSFMESRASEKIPRTAPAKVGSGS